MLGVGGVVANASKRNKGFLCPGNSSGLHVIRAGCCHEHDCGLVEKYLQVSKQCPSARLQEIPAGDLLCDSFVESIN